MIQSPVSSEPVECSKQVFLSITQRSQFVVAPVSTCLKLVAAFTALDTNENLLHHSDL